MSLDDLSFDFESLRGTYARGRYGPHDVVAEVYARLERDRERVRNVWLHVVPEAQVHAALDRAAARVAAGERLPLFGVPFAVKDNIDVAGAPTTAACPDFAYVPSRSAAVVERLVAAGALVIGKVNLDQFATGLVGTRSPYGTPTNPFDARMIPGGSSSGSAVSVAAGQVAFALGTDTAGSGRVPAAYGNVVGLKPSCGALSTRGVVPACRSLDCVSVFALTVPDACAVAAAASGYDPLDPFSRADAGAIAFGPAGRTRRWRIGVPPAAQRIFFDDDLARAAFDRAVSALAGASCTLVEVDLAPFRDAGDMLYGGPWVAERLFATRDLLDKPGALLPVIREIILEGRRFDARAVFEATYRLRALRRSAAATWDAVDALMVPTTPTIYRVDEVLADPRRLNSNLGVYTTFANLMDLAAVAAPAGFRADGLPVGVMLLGPRGTDAVLAAVAQTVQRLSGATLGATGHPLPAHDGRPEGPRSVGEARGQPGERGVRSIAVVGAHLSGQPLNHQLVDLGATLVGPAATAPSYRLFALRGTVPPKPGLARVREGGRAIEVEIWSLDEVAFGAFVAAVPRPLCIGSVEVDEGTFVPGFLCEPEALADAIDITDYGGWRAYLQATSR